MKKQTVEQIRAEADIVEPLDIFIKRYNDPNCLQAQIAIKTVNALEYLDGVGNGFYTRVWNGKKIFVHK